MYMAALEFLEDERESWRPFEALAALSDAELERASDPGSAAHGWSGRDLMAHMAAWRQVVLDTARELAMGEHSENMARVDAAFEADPGGFNAALLADWSALPLDEVRRRFGTIPGEVRGYLTVVPETRWVKNAAVQRFIAASTFEHDEEHGRDLEAILVAARS